MPHKEFEILILKKLNEVQEKSENEYKEIGKLIQDINEKFIKEIDTLNKNKQKFWN